MTIATTWANNPSVAQGLTFNAPLMTSLVPVSARGSYTPTFTRATTAYVTGYAADAVAGASQYLILCDSGEARFSGARRVSAGVWSNVLSDGTAIPAATLKGYLAEGARTNLCLQSRGFDTTWTLNFTATLSQDQVGVDGVSNTAWTLDDTDAVNISSISQSFTIANDSLTHVASLYILKDSNTSRCPCLRINVIGGVTPKASREIRLNTSTGAYAESGSPEVFGVEDAGLWWRVYVGVTNNTTGNTTLQVQLFFAFSATVGGAGSGALTGSIVADAAQLEKASFPSSFIATTTASVTRNSDVLTYVFANNASVSSGTAYSEVKTNHETNGTYVYVSTAANSGLLYNTSLLTDIRIDDGANNATKSGLTSVATAVRKRAGTWGSAGLTVTGDGAAPATGLFDGAIGSTNITIGTDAGLTFFPFCTVRNVRIYNRQFTDSQLQAITV